MHREQDSQEAKGELRQRLKEFRRDLGGKRDRSEAILTQVRDTEHYRQACVVLFYVDARGEVQTRQALNRELADRQRRCVVPFCAGVSLALCEIKDFTELSRGAFGILEPKADLRCDSARRVVPGEVDLAIIPGLGFDRRGHRLGYGAGYYDRLIPLLRPDCLKVGLAYECQVVSDIPTAEHDQTVDWIVTEHELIVCNEPQR